MGKVGDLIDYLLEHENCTMDSLIERADKNEFLQLTASTEESLLISVQAVDKVIKEAVTEIAKDPSGTWCSKDLVVALKASLTANSEDVSLSTVIGALKCFRKAYKDRLGIGLNEKDREDRLALFDRIFDRFELGLIDEWTGPMKPELPRADWDAEYLMTNDHRCLSVLDDLPDPLVILDVNGNIRTVNRSYFSTFLVDNAQEHPSHEASVIFDLPSSIAEPIMAFLKGPEDQSEFKADMPSCVGLRRFTIRAKRLIDRTGADLGTVVIFNDITELEKTMRDLLLADEKIRLLGEMTRHDTLNLLTVINGNLQLMEMKAPDTTLAKYIRTSVEATKDIKRLMEAGRDYQRMGSKEAVWVNLSKAVSDSAEKVGGMDKELAIEVDEAREVFADPMFERAFINLFFNTMKHASAAKTIRVSEDLGDDGSLTVWYEDDGPGIPIERKSSLFDEKLGRRTGHGLHFTRRLLQITGMDIREVGEHGKGVRFALTIPNHGHRTAP